jgi:hypothetical protein
VAWVGYASNWYVCDFYEQLGVAAMSWRLVGLGGACFAHAADAYRDELELAERVGDGLWEQVARRNIIRLRIELARLLLAEGRPGTALRFAEEAHRAEYDDPAAAAFLWQVRHAVGDQAEARRELLLMGMEEPLPETLIALGEVHLAEGNIDDAGYYAERARQTASEAPELWYLLARIHLQNPQGGTDAYSAAGRAAALAGQKHAIAYFANRQRLEIAIMKAHNAGQEKQALWLMVRTWTTEHYAFAIGVAGYILILFLPGLVGLFAKAGDKQDSENSAEGESAVTDEPE